MRSIAITPKTETAPSRSNAPVLTICCGIEIMIPTKIHLGDTVTDTLFRDLLPEPQQEHRSRGQGDNRRNGCPGTRNDCSTSRQNLVQTECLHDRQHHRRIARLYFEIVLRPDSPSFWSA